jgi:hypothetical protein
MEILLRSAEESFVKLSPAADFNRANLACKWGILARYRGEWDLAEERFAKAIAMLEPLTETGRRAMAFQELGSAWFHRGDVALARYRESRLPECLAFARSCYERSVECDSLGGGNTDLARRRLEDCHRG